MSLSTSSAEARPRAAAASSTHVRNRFIDRFDDLAMRIADRAPSTRALLIILGFCALALVALAMTGAKKPGSSPAFIEATRATQPPLTASAGAHSSAAASSAAASTTAVRQEPVVTATAAAPAPTRSDTGWIPPAASSASAPPGPAPRMEIVRTDRPPRVVDVTRSEPLSPNAAEIVRAEALPPRVVDAPRPEAAVGATSRAVIESTLSSPPPVPERAPASEPATPAAL